jgi:hypothetical protein
MQMILLQRNASSITHCSNTTAKHQEHCMQQPAEILSGCFMRLQAADLLLLVPLLLAANATDSFAAMTFASTNSQLCHSSSLRMEYTPVTEQ